MAIGEATNLRKPTRRLSDKLAATLSSIPPIYTCGMSNPARTLYLVCYDVADPRRLYRVHRFLLGYKTGGQRSFFECWLTKGELSDVRCGLIERLDAREDRAHIFQLDPRQRARQMGCAQPVRREFMIL
ncbi:MAG: CRISPR-associated endonuclease Cas2 [Candidatus Accumulibacter sp.]|jgi:CRISPR-associated protein Cas2|nr:CRISPR-associated endonuclease Cas2 [Accumulibacter sp.]